MCKLTNATLRETFDPELAIKLKMFNNHIIAAKLIS